MRVAIKPFTLINNMNEWFNSLVNENDFRFDGHSKTQIYLRHTLTNDSETMKNTAGVAQLLSADL